MAGILASMLAGAGVGGFKAMGDNADDNIKAGIEARKQAALDARQKTLMRIQHEYQTGRDDINYQRTIDRQAITDKTQQDRWNVEDDRWEKTNKQQQGRYDVEDSRWEKTNKQQQGRYDVEDSRWEKTNKQQQGRYDVEDSRWEKTNNRLQTLADQNTTKFNREEADLEIKQKAKTLYAKIENMVGRGNYEAMLANADPEVASIVRSAIAAKKAGNEEKYWDQLEKQTNILSKQAEIDRFGQPDMNKINQKAAEIAQKAKDSFLTMSSDQAEAQKIYDQAYADYRSAAAGGWSSTSTSTSLANRIKRINDMGKTDNTGDKKTTQTGVGLLSGKQEQNTKQSISPMTKDEIRGMYQFEIDGDMRGNFKGEQRTTPLTGIQKWAGWSQDGGYEKFGEGKIEMTLRQLGIETDLQKQKNIADALKNKYPDASEDQIVMMIKQSVRKGL